MSCGISEEEIKEQIALKEQIKNLNFSKTKTIKPKHNVLIAYSGGQSSTAMLNLTISSMNNQSIAHKLMMKPYLLYIDETTILNDEFKSKEYSSRINRILSDCKIETRFFSKLELYFSKNEHIYTTNADDLLIDVDASNILHQTLNGFESATAKEEFLRKIRTNLIHRIAEAANMNFVFLGSNSTRLSIQLLTDVAQGKGNQIDSEICFADDRHSNVQFLKPMREFISKEITFWNKLTGDEFVEIEDLMTKKSAKSSIGKITEQFINYLQKDYPATTYTISRIGYKLQNQNELKKRCLFCRSPVDEIVENKLSAQTALVITNSYNKSSKETFDSNYCYGCNILLRESDKPDNLIEKF